MMLLVDDYGSGRDREGGEQRKHYDCALCVRYMVS